MSFSKFLNRLKERPFVSASLLIATLLFVVGAKFLWWHTIGAPEPGYTKVCRLLSLVLAFVTLGALFANMKYRARLMLLAGIGGMLLPMLVLLYIEQLDAKNMFAAVSQSNQARTLCKEMADNDFDPQENWLNKRPINAQPILNNTYTFADGVETVAIFFQKGWYLTFAAGALVSLASWLWNGRRLRMVLYRNRYGFLAASIIGLLVFTGGPMISYYFYAKGRDAEATGDYQAALHDYLREAKWDPRVSYDLISHYQIGRLYGNLNMRQEPEFWAYIADNDASMQMAYMSYEIYQDHIPNPRINPVIQLRAANLLLLMAADDYVNHRMGSCIEKLHRASQLDPYNIEIMYALAMAQTKIRDNAEAIVSWRRLVTLNEDVGIAKSKYVVGYTYRKVITANAWSNMAGCYAREGDYPKVLICRANAIQTGPTNTDLIDADDGAGTTDDNGNN